MLRLLRWLFIGHVHQWVTDEWVPLDSRSGSRGRRYYLRCKCCGDVAKRDLI